MMPQMNLRMMPTAVGLQMISSARRVGRGRGKRNLLTDLIRPHMNWKDGNKGPPPKISYQDFRAVTLRLINQLKQERQLVRIFLKIYIL